MEALEIEIKKFRNSFNKACQISIDKGDSDNNIDVFLVNFKKGGHVFKAFFVQIYF